MNSLTIVLGRAEAALREAVHNIAPDAEILPPDQLARAQIIYGGVEAGQLAGAERLRWLQLASAGVNRWPVAALGERGVLVTTTSGIHAAPIVEQMFGMLLMKTRCLDVALTENRERVWNHADYGGRVSLISGKTLGVLGVGAIGEHAARVGQAFGMRVFGLRRSGQAAPAVERMFRPAQRREFFAACDVVMNTLPLTGDTRHFMGRAEFAALPAGAIVINFGRGATIDTSAMLGWLQGEAAGAALLDVTDPEPLPPSHPLWQQHNVFVTPHYGGARPDYDERADAVFLDNLGRFVRGEPLQNLVDSHAGY